MTATASPTPAPGHRTNFDTLMRAAKRGDLALVSCTDAKTGEPAAAICVVNHEPNGAVDLVPVARMFNSNPYEELLPPDIE